MESVRTAPSRGRISRFWRVITALVLLAVGAQASWFHRETHSFCEACNSRRVEERTRLLGWSGLRVPGTHDRDDMERSHAMRDFFSSEHTHAWRVAPGPVIREGLRAVTQAGSGSPSALHIAYESDAELRGYLLKQVRTGLVAREDLVRLFVAAGRYGTGLSQADGAAREAAARIRPILLDFERLTGAPLGFRFLDG